MGEAFATSVASNLVSKLGGFLIAPIGRQFGYVLCYKSYVKDLEKELKELESARERVQHSVQVAENDGKPIENDIKNWLERVNDETEQADNLLKHGQSAKDACFRGWLPNPVVRLPIGRKVKKMTQVIQGLREKSRESNFQKVYYENPPIGIVTGTTSAAKFVDSNEDVLESRAKITEDVLKAIVDDMVCVIGVWGPGGVGKSKLLEDVERRVKQEKLFDLIATANVSHNPVKTIQGDIAYALGLKLMNEESARGRADLLCKKLESDPEKSDIENSDPPKNILEKSDIENSNPLKKIHRKKILIILDNLWDKLELKEVGIPCGYDNKVRGCKLLITSRNRDVLRTDMGSDQVFELSKLELGEARRLFKRTVGDKVKDLEFEPLVDGVVKNCRGLPLLIVAMAKRLKHRDLAAWKIAPTHIDAPVKSIVEESYNGLNDKTIKSLFLVCALTSGRILMRTCLVYCMGLGLYKEFSETIQNARDRLIMGLHSLQDSSLLLDSVDMELFKMHDEFVDKAISIASTEWNALVGRKDCGFNEWSKDELRKCIAISFHYVGIDDLPNKLDCPNLTMLLLLENNPSLKVHESFFESMEKLQVLDLSSLSFTSLPSSVEFLQNLKSLCLDHCHLEDVTVLGKLTRLQFLSFAMSTISRLPKEIGELTKLRFLDLTGCTRLQVIEPGVLGRLVNLEELYMADSFDQWDDKNEAPRSNANLAELKNMKKLSTLYISIPHSANLPMDLPFGNLNKHNIQIGGVWDWSGKYKESRTLKLKSYSCNLLLDKWVQRCLQRTQDLHLVGLQDGKDSIHDLCTEGFQELTHLHVQNSPSFHYVVHSTKYIQYFTVLEWLFLENLNNLEKICRGCLAPESFSKLKILKVDNCGEIKYLFPLSMTRIFFQLEEIEVSNCHLMQQIVSDAETDEDGDEMDVQPKVKSCNLLRLTLRNLPEMTSFCKTEDHPLVYFDKHQLIKLQNLEAMTIERCQLIQEVFDLEGLTVNGDVEILSRLTELTLSDLPSLARIWSKNLRRALCFRKLRTLKVQNCEKLRFLFSSSMAKVLSQIKEIKIVSCELMEEIINVQEEELEEAAISNTIEFPLLTSLSFEGLPNLRTFSYREYCIDCPSLTKLTISGCPKMMTFSSFKGRQQPMTTDTGVQQAFGRINSSLPLHGFFNENVHFPSLEELKLSSMGQLKRIWHNQLHGKSFCKLASLTVELCENLSHVFPSNSMDRLQSLNKIEVVGCPSLEALFEPVSLSHEKRQKPLVLSALKKMKLLNLPRLRDILKSDCKVTLGFPSLMEVNVRRCHSLPYLFSSATAKTLAKLSVLDVSCCNNLWGIIVMENGEGNIVETLKFPHLSTLKLGDLDKLISFRSASCAGHGLHPLFDEKLALPNLEELHIEGVQHKELWNEKILVESFCHLKVLKVKQCPNLMNVIPSFMWKRLLHCVEFLTIEKCPSLRNLCTMSMAKFLGQLKYLGLGGCGEMEYIIATEGEKPEEAENRIVIPQLVTLYLHNMPKLKSFCQGQHISEWPSLKEFTIEDCKAVEVILGDASCRRLEGSVLTQQPLLLVEKVEFPNMESMKISHMDNMEKIWLDDLASNAFSKLKTLVVEYCEKLSSIFSSYTMLTRFQNIEKVTVTDCGSLEVVFHAQEFSKDRSTSTFQLRELALKGLPKMKHVWSGLPQGGLTFGHLQCMGVVKCESLKSLFPSSVAKSLTRLEELLVWDCGVEEIIAEEDGVRMNADDLFFPRLTDLRLLELPELRSFYMNSRTSTWPLLKELRVRHCPKTRSFSLGTTTNEKQPALFSFEKVIPQLEGSTLGREDLVMLQHHTFVNLKHLSLSCYHDENASFPSDFLLHRFPNLEQLVVPCNSFDEIFPEDASIHGGASLKALGNLKRLRLIKLCNLRQVWRDGSLMAEILKQIEFLCVVQCPNLSIVFPSRAAFQRLTELRVGDCAGLVHMGTCSAMTTLVHLTLLNLSGCGAMEDVVTDDGNGVEEISFPKLELLILNRLPSLESFSPANCAFVFPSLVRITVTQCPKMNTFCNGALRTPKLNGVYLSFDRDDEGRWEGDLNTTIQTLLT